MNGAGRRPERSVRGGGVDHHMLPEDRAGGMEAQYTTAWEQATIGQSLCDLTSPPMGLHVLGPRFHRKRR
jgi:hypothetical protein